MERLVFIEGEGVNLSPLEHKDKEFIARYRNHPSMHSLLLQKYPMSSQEAEKMIEESDDIDFLITNEGNRVGSISVMSVDYKESRAMIGYFIIPESQGEGYATESVELTLEYIFKELGVHKVGAITYEHNEPSQKVLEKNGFEKEGILKEEKYIDGVHRDCPRYGITKEMWEKNK